MKINYSIFPFLEFFDKNRLSKVNGKVSVRKEDMELWNNDPFVTQTVQYTINEVYQGYISNKCGENIYILMPKFQEAIKKSSSAFKNISRGVQLEKLFEDCCIFIGDMVYVCYKLTNDTYLGTQFNTTEHSNNYMVTIYNQGKGDDKKERHVVYLGTLVFSKEDDKTYRIELSLISSWMGLYADNYNDNEQLIDAILGVLMFKHYAKVELDVIPGHKKIMSSIANEKVMNETPQGIRIMDSNWFTTIYRIEGFDVRGHIRYYKDRDKISYVKPHKRKGYIRRAKILDDPTAEPNTIEHDTKLNELENN